LAQHVDWAVESTALMEIAGETAFPKIRVPTEPRLVNEGLKGLPRSVHGYTDNPCQLVDLPVTSQEPVRK
jgi:hypothetical protein